MRSYLSEQIREISNHVALRTLGVGLGAVHILTYFYWFSRGKSDLASALNRDPICWPFIPNCESWKFLSSEGVLHFGYLYLALAVLGALCFLGKSFVKIGYVLIATLVTMKLFLFWQDYRFMGNYHYMTFLVSFLFLFVPNKIWTIQRMIVAFYLSAGTLKLNSEWLSGAAIPIHWLHPGTLPFWVREKGLLPLSCAYAFLLEVVVVFGLLSKKATIFWLAFLQFVAFHVFSYWIVGWFYPATMACLLILFPADFILTAQHSKFAPAPKNSAKSTANTLAPWKRAMPIASLTLFAAAQLVPWLIPGDAAVTGQGRMFAINMFDSVVQCYSKSLAIYENSTVDVSTVTDDWVGGVRIHCDPYVFFYRAKKACEFLAGDAGFSRLSLSIVSKRTSDSKYQEIVSLPDVCQNQVTYSSLLPNSWIHK